MNPIDDETLQAYVDGQLDPAATARVEAAIAADPALAARVAKERALLGALRGAFDPVLDEPVPERLAALLQPAAAPPAAVSSIDAHRARKAARPRRRWFVPAAAVAASVAILAVLFWHAPTQPLIRTHGEASFAAGALRRALDTQLASAPDAASDTSIGVTFRSADGAVCRTFVHRAEPAMAGLACRKGDAWALPVITSPAAAAPGTMQQAASDLPPVVQAAVDARIRGDAFDATQEREARADGWR